MSASYAAIQAAIEKIPEVRSYKWDTSPYEPVAEWEASALAAVQHAFGMDSQEAKELSTVITDEAWKNTNRPDAVPPEVFVNRDFQTRMDNLEKMLRDYAARLPAPKSATASQKPRKGRRASTKKRRTGRKKGSKKTKTVKRRTQTKKHSRKSRTKR